MMSQTTASALNNRIVTFVNAIPKEMECAICFKIADDPVRCGLSCRVIFCSVCMQQALDRRRKCPTCGKEIDEDTDIRELRDTRIRSDILDYTVYCINKGPDQSDDIDQHSSTDSRKRKAALDDDKCLWTGKYDQLAAHLNQCDFEMVRCTNNGCAAKIERWMLGRHLQMCIHRVANCGHCNVVVKSVAMPGHLLKCPKVDVSCECGFECTRDALTAHRDKNCPLVEICCDVIGCDAKMKRGDYEKHQDEAATQHVRLLSAALGREVGMLKQENVRLSNEVGMLKQGNVRLLAGFDSLKQENVRLIAAAGVLEKLVKVVSTNSMQVKWRLTDIAAKLLEAAVDKKSYYSPRFDVFFRGGHKLNIIAVIQGQKLGLYLYKDVRLSDDKSLLYVGGFSFTVTKAGLPGKKETFLRLGWGSSSFLDDMTLYIDNDCINIVIDFNLNKAIEPLVL